jgi:hypothetical protein
VLVDVEVVLVLPPVPVVAPPLDVVGVPESSPPQEPAYIMAATVDVTSAPNRMAGDMFIAAPPL